MAEIAGVAMGAVSLVPLFNMVIKEYHYFQLAQDFGSDFQYSLVTLRNAGIRLTQWGESVGLIGPPVDQSTLEGVVPENARKDAEQHLGELNRIMRDARRQSEDFSACKFIYICMAEILQNGMLTRYTDQVKTEEEHGTVTLTDKMCNLSFARSKKTKAKEKAKWAIVSKQSLGNKIDQICKLVSDLEELYPASKKAQQKSAAEEIGYLGSADVEDIMKYTTQKDQMNDMVLRGAMEKAKTQGKVSFGTLGKGIQNTGTITTRDIIFN